MMRLNYYCECTAAIATANEMCEMGFWVYSDQIMHEETGIPIDECRSALLDYYEKHGTNPPSF